MARFKSGNFNVAYKEHPGRSEIFEDDELETLLYEHPCKTLYELLDVLNVDVSSVSRRLHTMGKIQRARELGALRKRETVNGVFSPVHSYSEYGKRRDKYHSVMHSQKKLRENCSSYEWPQNTNLSFAAESVSYKNYKEK